MAVVEVFIQSNTSREKPSVSALLPREKTYNVAAITEKNLSISGTMPTQVASVSGGFLRSRKSYYVVQDQDTLASTFEVENKQNNRVGVWWIFRPVLGQVLVRPGPRLTFVQVAVPRASDPNNSLGNHKNQQHLLAEVRQKDRSNWTSDSWLLLRRLRGT